MNQANKLWETHRTMDKEIIHVVTPILSSTSAAEPHLQELVSKHKKVTFIIGEADGEHTVRGHVIGYGAESGGSLQIRNEWGRFYIPIANIVRMF